MPATCNNNISVDDIEDLLKNGENADDLRQGNKSVVKHIRSRKKSELTDVTDKPNVDSFIPENFKVYVKTWGCTHNSSDSEYMAGLLATNGYIITNNKLAADVWLLNSCTVKTPAEDHFKNEISSARSLGKYLVVSGCVPQGAPNTGFLQGLSMIGVQQIDRVVEVVEETLKGNTVRFLHEKKDHGKKTGGASLLLPKIRKNPLIEIIPINTGCLNHCTYCKTKHARGQLGSYPIEEIVARAKQAFEEGVCELWLTSEDTGAYGRDIGVSLPELLWKVVDVIPEGCMLRLGMTNPPYILEHMQAMAAVLSHPRVYSFLHIPVQSGCDGVLGEMKREYTRAEFCTLVDFLVERVQGITIATDIICGFPTETEKDFEESLRLVEKYKFPSLFINQFYPRPGTPAAKMPRLSTQETKRRSRLMSELFSTFYPYEGREGNLYSVLFTEVSHDGKYCVGHNKYYEQIVVPYDESLMGKRVSVEVKSTSKHCMVGEVGIGEIPHRCSLAAPLQQGQPSSNVNNSKPKVPQTIDIDDRPYRLPDDNTLLLMVIAAFAFVLILRLYQHLSRNWSHYQLYLESLYSS